MKDDQALVEFLRTELNALEAGDYGVSKQQPWRARLVFEDCPCCPNYGERERKVPCSQCPLIDLVPMNRRHEKIPCRFIRLNAKGETIDSLYRTGTEQELEATMGDWLRKTIHELENSAPVKTAVQSKAIRPIRSGHRRNAND
jgi:hypothetical protein